MAKPALEENVFTLSEKNERERNRIERLWKSQWLSDYALDIFKTMKESEMRRRPVHFISTQIHEKPKLIQLCQRVSRIYKLNRSSLHLAIYYLDRFLDFYTVREDKLQLIALTCLHIAAQIENQDAIVPRYSEMNRLIQNSYTPFEYRAVERKLLLFFEFKLMRPSTASFVEMFACSFLTREDYASYNQALNESPELLAGLSRFNSYEQMLASLAQILLHLSDYTLSINKFSNVPPSLLAAACIAATRQISGVLKRWTPYLAELTSYEEHMVEPYVDILTMYYYYETSANVKRQAQLEASWLSPDSGYEESNSTTEVEDVSFDVESVNTIPLKMQSPCKKEVVPRKRARVNDSEEQKAKRSKLN